MSTLTCLIVDDEAPARQRLRRLLDDLEGLNVVGEAGNGVEALEQAAALRPQLIFLDIEMPELDGLGVAAALAADSRRRAARDGATAGGANGPTVVFVTAYDQHALRVFELSAVDYVIKPVRSERLAAAVDKVRARGGTPVDLGALLSKLPPPPTRRMAVRSGARFVVFDPERVCAILARDDYSAILVDGKELLSDEPLDELQRRLGATQLLRVHRSAIVNLSFLRELVHEGDRRYVAVLSDPGATRVAVSRERLPALKAALGLS
jgi:two-component system LytT family response regulator